MTDQCDAGPDRLCIHCKCFVAGEQKCRAKRQGHQAPDSFPEAEPLPPPTGPARQGCCGGPPVTRKPKRLGDYTEGLLKSIGITEARYKAAKEFAGLAPTCNCAARKEWLNKVSDWWRRIPGRAKG